ncbi:hypothetical protein [Spirillospora sp. CA-128828]|uniref:hypothetical protein n=1 Tax=Spirillospora sp. CA-128828 TaxID=3240033 RepID=UPI003D905FBE
MSSTTTSRSPVGPMWIGVALMLFLFGFQQIGIGSTTGMWALQASAWIVGIGTPVLWFVTYRRYGRPSEWTPADRVAIRRVTGGNLAVNIGWPFAGLMIGLGPASSVMALGPVSVGLLEDIRKRRWTPVLLRLGVLGWIVVATEGWELFNDASWTTVLGLFAAAGGAWHFWNIPKAQDIWAKGETEAKAQEKLDQGMLASNKRAAPIIIGVAVIASLFFGHSWVPGGFTAGSLLEVFLRGATAGLCVFVAGILLTNRAKKYLHGSTLGLMFAFSPVVAGIIGDVGGRLGWIQGNQELSLVNWIGIFGVSVFAFWTARVQRKINDAGEAATVPEQAPAVPEAGLAEAIDQRGVREDTGIWETRSPEPITTEHPWAKYMGEFPEEPASANRGGKVHLASIGSVDITAEGVQVHNVGGLTYRYDDMSAEIETVGELTVRDGRLTGFRGSNISVVRGGVPVSISDAGEINVGLTDGTFKVRQASSVDIGGGPAAV